MRQVSQLNLTVNARKMSIPVTRDGGKKTETNQLHPTFSQRPPGRHTGEVQHRQETFCYNTHSQGTRFLSSPCDPAYTPTKSRTAPSNKIQRSIPLLFYQEHSVLSFFTRALNSTPLTSGLMRSQKKNTLTDALRITMSPMSRKSRGGNHSKKFSSVLQRHDVNMMLAVCAIASCSPEKIPGFV